MSSLNLKQKVKEGKLTPQAALEQLLNGAKNQEAAANSRTARWLKSTNALTRYYAARRKPRS